MQILILGGTRFLGRHCAEQALARGWTVSLLHRGKSGPELFPAAEHLIADRYGDLDVLDGRSWDAVIDCSGQSPRAVKASVRRLSGAHYTFVSTVSVYLDPQEGDDEEVPLHPPLDPEISALGNETYAGCKVACELAVHDHDGPTSIVRPGLIVGPWDPTERFTYWVRRMQRGGQVLCPGTPDQPVQIIDVRDLATFLLDGAEQRRTGVFNAVGVPRSVTLGDVINACASDVPAEQIWMANKALTDDHKLAIWTDLPLWLTPDHLGFELVDVRRALEAGLSIRPLAETVADTWTWAREREPLMKMGIDAEREAEILG